MASNREPKWVSTPRSEDVPPINPFSVSKERPAISGREFISLAISIQLLIPPRFWTEVFPSCLRGFERSVQGGFGLLRPYNCRISSGGSRFLCHYGQNHQTHPTILWRSALRGSFPGVLGFGVRVQTLAMENNSTFIVVRRLIPEKPSWQLSLFKMACYTYHVIVTNLSLQPLNLWRFYNQRATGELIIRELLEAYTLGKIPARDWASNQAYFHLVLFAYNLINWFKRLCLPPDWQQLNLQTIRNRLLLVPGQLLRPQGRPTLSLPNSYPYSKTFMQILRNIKILDYENS